MWGGDGGCSKTARVDMSVEQFVKDRRVTAHEEAEHLDISYRRAQSILTDVCVCVCVCVYVCVCVCVCMCFCLPVHDAQAKHKNI